MNMRSYWCSYQVKAVGEGCCLTLNDLDSSIDNVPLELILQHKDLRFARLDLLDQYLCLHHDKLLILDHTVFGLFICGFLCGLALFGLAYSSYGRKRVFLVHNLPEYVVFILLEHLIIDLRINRECRPRNPLHESDLKLAGLYQV